jgi:sialate O-acetylesterase
MPSVFSDHMVLQRGRPVPVWGRAPAGQAVSVQLAGETVETAADVAGRWRVELPAMPAAGPRQMLVECGGESMHFSDVLVGDVWVCSGQSNMGFVLQNADDGEQEVAEADWPEMRLLGVPQVTAETPQEDFEGRWEVCRPQTARDFSAVAYFFGRSLHRELGVPIGLIDTSWGGTPAESWVPRPALQGDPNLESVLMRWDAVLARYPASRAEYEALRKEYEQARERSRQQGLPEPQPPAEPMGRGHQNAPGTLYNAMVAPLVPYGIRGATWYQGESNAGRAYEYRYLLQRLIRSWRERWKQGDFPFLVVQLANFKRLAEEPRVSSWAELREAQAMALDLPNTGLAVTIDIGEADDIHPTNKQDVGKRLALCALHGEYGRDDIDWTGPVLESMGIGGETVRVKFAHAEGLHTADGGPVRGFALAGADREWHWADGQIKGDTVVLSADPVTAPVAVRYAWADNPPCNLENAAGLPARPFRTDEWPGSAGTPGRGLQEVYTRPEPVDLPHAGRPIEVDGDLSEWEHIPPMPLPHHEGRPGRVKLAWREDGLYGAVTVQSGPPEPAALNAIGPDGLELWVDKSLDRAVMMTGQTSQYAFCPGPEQGTGRAHVALGADVYRGHRLDCAWVATETGYRMEFRIPADLLGPAELAAGCELGLNFTLSIAGRPAEHFYTDKERDASWCTPVTWGIVRLAD